MTFNFAFAVIIFFFISLLKKKIIKIAHQLFSYLYKKQIKKKNSMKTMNQDYAVFYAVFAKSTASAWLLERISLDEGLKEVVINKSYFPKSKLDFSVHSKTKKIVRCVVPEWLWVAKMEEAAIYNPPAESAFDQFEQMFATEKRKETVLVTENREL